MKYDFDEIIERRGTGCCKWDDEPEEGVIPMWVADMDFRTAPCVLHALQQRVAHGVFGYTQVPEAYYEAVISWFHNRHGWTIGRQWIQYTSGVVPALSCIIKAFTEPGDEVILQPPVYNCFFSSVRNNKCSVLNSSLTYSGGRYTIDLDDLEQQAARPRAKLLVLCNPHNPVGRVWTRQELQQVADICRRHQVVVVADEIHNELVYGQHRYVPFGTVDMDNAVVCTSPSKAFNVAGLQIANIICSNPDWQSRIDHAINDNEVCDVNPFGVAGLMAAYGEGGEWLDQLRRYLYDNYQALCHYLGQHAPALSVLPLEGTYLVWVDVRSLGVSSDVLTERLLSKGRLRVNSGTMYGQEDGEGFIRLNIACPRSLMMEGLRRMVSVIGEDFGDNIS